MIGRVKRIASNRTWCLIFVTIILLLFLNYIWSVWKLPPVGFGYFYLDTNRVPRLLRDYCQFLEEPVTGQEGALSPIKFQLRAILITTRHGERSPLVPEFPETYEKERNNCGAFREEDRAEFEKYRRFVTSNYFRTFMKMDNKLAKLGRLPLRNTCRNGHMTVEGALQMASLGFFLQRRYAKWELFSDESSRLNVSLYSTIYPRTFQSAIAFAYGFLSKFKRWPKDGYFLKASASTHFCTSHACKCPKLAEWQKLYLTERDDYFFQRSPAFAREKIIADADMALRMTEARDPLKFLDYLLGRHICRREALPCDTKSGKCTSWNTVSMAIDLATERTNSMFAMSNKSTTRKLFIGQAAAILKLLRWNIVQLRKDPKMNIVKLFSGHDVTLTPLLYALGLKHSEPPHYASRLVIEIYQSNKPIISDELFVRVLFNGRDRTGEIPFCNKQLNYGFVCPARQFESFIKKDLYLMAAAPDLATLCSATT